MFHFYPSASFKILPYTHLRNLAATISKATLVVDLKTGPNDGIWGMSLSLSVLIHRCVAMIRFAAEQFGHVLNLSTTSRILKTGVQSYSDYNAVYALHCSPSLYNFFEIRSKTGLRGPILPIYRIF